MCDILENTVVQCNPLIEAQKRMNVSGLRLFTLGLQGLNIKNAAVNLDDDSEFPEIIITPKELEEVFGSTGNFQKARRQIERIFERSNIKLREKDGGFELNHIYRRLKYKPEVGLLIQFDKLMKPHILNIDAQYTSYKVKEVFPLSSEYAWRIMELLQGKNGYFKKGNSEVYVELSMEELREALNIPETAYRGRINNFRVKVLDNPIGEINRNIKKYVVRYEVKKTGRRVTGFKILMRLRNEEEKAEQEKADEQRRDQEDREALKKSQALQILTDAGVTLFRAKKFVKQYGEERCMVNYDIAKAAYDKGGVDDLAAYICRAIEEDFGHGNLLFTEEQQRQKEERDARNEAIAAAGAAALQKEYAENMANSDLSPEWKAKLVARKEQIVNNKKME